MITRQGTIAEHTTISYKLGYKDGWNDAIEAVAEAVGDLYEPKPDFHGAVSIAAAILRLLKK